MPLSIPHFDALLRFNADLRVFALKQQRYVNSFTGKNVGDNVNALMVKLLQRQSITFTSITDLLPDFSKSFNHENTVGLALRSLITDAILLQYLNFMRYDRKDISKYINGLERDGLEKTLNFYEKVVPLSKDEQEIEKCKSICVDLKYKITILEAEGTLPTKSTSTQLKSILGHSKGKASDIYKHCLSLGEFFNLFSKYEHVSLFTSELQAVEANILVQRLVHCTTLLLEVNNIIWNYLGNGPKQFKLPKEESEDLVIATKMVLRWMDSPLFRTN